MKPQQVQVTRIEPPLGAYWISNNRCHDENRTSDWKVWFFKTFSGSERFCPHRFIAATVWQIHPKEQTEEAVIEELKRQAAKCGYGKIEVFGITSPNGRFSQTEV